MTKRIINSLSDYLATNLGLKANVATKMNNCIKHFVLAGLLKEGSVNIYGVGTFKYVKKITRQYVKFYPAEGLLTALKRGDGSGTTEFELSLATVDYPVPLTVTELMEAVELSQQEVNSPHQLAENFFWYLRNRFPNDKVWRHPTSLKVYSSLEVKNALELYRQLDPPRYSMLWCLWISSHSRDKVCKARRINEQELITGWYEAIDMVLFILINPELVPVYKESKEANLKMTLDAKPALQEKYLDPFKRKPTNENTPRCL